MTVVVLTHYCRFWGIINPKIQPERSWEKIMGGGVGAPGTPLSVGRIPHELAARLGLPYRSGVLSSQGRQLQAVRMQRVGRPTTTTIINKEKDECSNRAHGTVQTNRNFG